MGRLMDQTENTRRYMHVWMVEDRKGKKFWTKVGIAQESRDGSWLLNLAAIPVTGRLHMTPAPSREWTSADTSVEGNA